MGSWWGWVGCLGWGVWCDGVVVWGWLWLLVLGVEDCAGLGLGWVGMWWCLVCVGWGVLWKGVCALGVGVGVLWFGVGLCLEFGGSRVVLLLSGCVGVVLFRLCGGWCCNWLVWCRVFGV